MGVHVLLIEDSETERTVTLDRLRRAGYEVTAAVDGTEGLRKLYDSRPDVVLLDVVMPGRDGWKTLELIREVSAVPVIMLTGADSSIERVRGLNGGADDYVVKPYDAAELLARIEAVLRRTGDTVQAKEVFDDGFVRIDYRASEVSVHGAPVQLTPLEYRLLAALTEHAGQVLSRDQLLELVWGDAHARSGDQVKLYVGYLRRKLEDESLIETVRGFGYRFVKRKR
jgi:DNA-binding response OmpR family regulator